VLAAALGVTALVIGVSPKIRERMERLVRDSGELSRPILWRAAWNLFREHPVTGTGAGSYNVLFERYRPERFADDPQWAHNDYLNTLSDYGGVGFVLFFGAVGAIVINFRRRDKDTALSDHEWLDALAVRRALGIGVLGFAFQLFVEFHFKIPALAMACATIAGLAVHPAGRLESYRRERRSWITVTVPGIVVIVLALAGVAMVRFYRGEALRYRARQEIDSYTRNQTGDLSTIASTAEAALRKAVTLAPTNGAAWADLAFALELRTLAQPDRAGEFAPPASEAASRAITITSVVPEFWIRSAVALAMLSRPAEAEEAFQRALQRAPKSAAGWYYYAHHLSSDTQQRAAALRAIAICLSLDPGNSAAATLRVKLMNERSSNALLAP
jgi:tetratricopeptide (TPR) repeat protein